MDLLDLGCGCGVLGLSVAILSQKKPKTLASWDLSPDAVDLTKKNIEKYSEQLSASNIATSTLVSRGLEELAQFPELQKQRQTNKLVIVCNYPYIPDETFEDNADECAKTWEPRMAFVGGPDGFIQSTVWGSRKTWIDGRDIVSGNDDLADGKPPKGVFFYDRSSDYQNISFQYYHRESRVEIRS